MKKGRVAKCNTPSDNRPSDGLNLPSASEIAYAAKFAAASWGLFGSENEEICNR